MAAAVILVAAAAAAGVVVMSSANQAPPSVQEPPANTAKVEQGKLSAIVSLFGTLTYRARSDGSPYAVINQARGTYTSLPTAGDQVGCGDVLYRVDDAPVLLLCGPVPAYRNLRAGDVGNDVRQLNQNLHTLGYDGGLEIDPTDEAFTPKTQTALEKLQHDKGVAVTGELGIGGAVFLPEPARIAKVTGELGGPAQPGSQVLDATSDTPEVQVALDPSQQGEIKAGDAAQITLPGNRLATGKVERLGTVAQILAGPNGNGGAATIPAYISLDDPAAARGFDAAPVQVDIATEGVQNVLSVPVTALVGKTGGGFAVEVVRTDGRHELVAVKLGLFDTSAGRVQVEGDLREGDQVVVPSP
ncbi:MAG: efflux RND transporter periplasmic adaptor subunit [Gemmatimonadales bacterium]